jgi:hypothetical protein
LTAQGPFCLALSSLFAGNPNGTWIISVTNTSSNNLSISVPAFQVEVDADSCLALNGVDQVVIVPPVSASVPAGQTKSITIEIPPLPSDFPSINPSCNAFGSPIQFYYKPCPIGIIEVTNIADFNIYPNPNTGKFIVQFEFTEAQSADLIIYNNIGQIALSKKIANNLGKQKTEIDMTGFASGIYHVNLITKNRVISRRLLIE